MTSQLYYSVAPDFSLRESVLNVYLPVLPNTKELIQEITDLKAPKAEYYDTTQKGHPLVAVEWDMRFGEIMLKKLSKKKKWQDLFGRAVGSR